MKTNTLHSANIGANLRPVCCDISKTDDFGQLGLSEHESVAEIGRSI